MKKNANNALSLESPSNQQKKTHGRDAFIRNVVAEWQTYSPPQLSPTDVTLFSLEKTLTMVSML